MLADYDVIATLGVKDLARAREFYEGVLGFAAPQELGDEGIRYAAGTTAFFVYVSAFAGTNEATAISFQVPPDAFAAEVAALRDKGVVFQTFEAEGIEWDDDVASLGGETLAVWFTDPDGNILNVESGG